MKKIYRLCFSFLLFTGACREKYMPSLNQPTTGYLVVEGFINSGSGATTIALSRSVKISDAITILKESKAKITVESKNNPATFSLTETATGSGVYSIPQLSLDAADQYRLRIITANGKQYVSDYSVVLTTVNIDSVLWVREKSGVQIYCNAHDDANKTKFYRYQYDETWEFHSSFASNLQVVNVNGIAHHVEFRNPLGRIDSTLYRCWRTEPSYNILVYSTEKLTQDRVSMFPVVSIEAASWKLSVLYSINLKQYAMSVACYRFYEQMKKNTQQLGSIFDAQPSDNTGNIHNVDDPAEPVIGFVEVTQEKTKRIFISNQLLPGWNYDQHCTEFHTMNKPDSIYERIGAANTPTISSGGMSTIYYSSNECVDCRLRGVSDKPVFWP